MQSRQGLTSPVGFTGYMALLTHGVGSICGSRMSPAIMLSRATEIASLLSIGTLRLACCTGAMLGSILMVYSPFRLPILSKEFGYISVSCSLSLIKVPTGSWNIGFSLHRGNSFTEPTLVTSLGSCWHRSSLDIHSVSLGISRWPVVFSSWYFSAICLPDRTVFYSLFSDPLHFRTEFC